MSEEDESEPLRTAEEIRREEIHELGKKLLPDEVEITESELDTEVRAEKGEEFGYED